MLIVTGTVAYDYIMDFPESFSDHILPDSLHKINLSFIVDRFEKRRGGTAGNASYSLGLLKIPHKLVSFAGKDFDDYAKTFKKLKIDISKINIDKKNYTATGFAMTDKSDNQIWGYFYGAAINSSKTNLSFADPEKDLVLVGPSGARGSMATVNECIKYKIPYMLDPGFILTEVSAYDLTKAVKNSTYVIGNDYEIELISNRVKGWEKIKRKKTVIKTLGKDGAEIEEDGKTIKIEPSKAKRAVDPTGAGDAWRSGFLAGLHMNLDLRTAGRMGAVAASFAVEHYGTQEHRYSIAEFKKRYRKNYNEVLNF